MNNAPVGDSYICGQPNLESRVISPNSQLGYSDCVFQKLNGPRGATNPANNLGLDTRGVPTGCARA
ncbi:uncharacterized protein F4807DRAFT_411696 [Annulohypoxylon truncatum]|uniref:uncharacterized protein n=1 Tax=Annulohypoxylon truncatum TaxID=327061 RepID=UPI00200765EE|nr:uncharacterized protein F4807DRAFT_411696 [Annulohypoxylon truncatum]KAI1213588.1 hypothetical protein F4807DRAFT_411696 [Annulohypoxylon truncatum]